MISRRGVVSGLAGLSGSALAGCGGKPPPPPEPVPSFTAFGPNGTWRPSTDGVDGVIDISHNVTVSDFSAVRSAGILAVFHKSSEGGDWIDPSYASRRRDA